MNALFLLFACATDEAPEAAVEPPPAVKAPPMLPPEELRAAGERDALAPSPDETRTAVEKAGLVTSLGSLVQPRFMEMDHPDKNRVAVRTGVVLAETILSVKEATDEDLAGSLKQIADGLSALGAGEGLTSTLDEHRTALKNGGITRDELLQSLDDIAGMADPDQGFGPGDTTGPLLQAGAWAAGIHVVSKAILAEDRIDAAETLLRQEAVLAWFQGYVRGHGNEQAPSEFLQHIDAELTAMQAVLAGEGTLDKADVEAIRDSSGRLLSLI